jgi:hypothetical protein
MPAATNQDFITFQGDAVSPVFTVFDVNNNVVDISAVSEITWTAQQNLQSAAVITKKKSTSGIAFTNSGTDGKFTVTITGADTSPLSGWYIHTASLTGLAGITTVTVGRMNVGQAPDWTYDDGTAATNDMYLLRGMIGDTAQSDQLLSDQIIIISLKRYSTVENAAAECCRFVAAKFAREVDIVQGQLKTNYSQKSKTYLTLAVKYDQLGYARGGVTAYTGATSVTDKDNRVLDTDRVPPQFNIGMFDNTLPESPVGHQTGVGQEFEQDVITGDESVDVI